MSYLRNPRIPYVWESDGEYNGKFRAADGTLHDSAEEADKHDERRNDGPAKEGPSW